jgi:Tfp pilus assembly protein PilF
MPANKFLIDVLGVRDELKKAEYALEVRRVDLAIELLHKMLQNHPENSAVFYTLARAYLAKKKLPEAVRSVRESLRLDPRSNHCHTLYGTILVQQNRLKEAEAEYRIALEIEPERAHTHHVYAALLIDKYKDLAQGRVHALKALELDPAEANYHITMAKLLALEGDFSHADEEFRNALSLDPESLLACRVYGWYLLYKRNSPEQAFEYLQRAMHNDPTDSATRKLFIIALKAKQKHYRFIWYFSFFLYGGGRYGRAIYLLVIATFVLLQRVLENILGDNSIYQAINTGFTILLFAWFIYVMIMETVLNSMIKHGRLR